MKITRDDESGATYTVESDSGKRRCEMSSRTQLEILDATPMFASGWSPLRPPGFNDNDEEPGHAWSWRDWVCNSPAARQLLTPLGVDPDNLSWMERINPDVPTVLRAGRADPRYDQVAVEAGLSYRVIILTIQGQQNLYLNEDGTRGAIVGA